MNLLTVEECRHANESIVEIENSYLEATHQCIDCWGHGNMTSSGFLPNSHYFTKNYKDEHKRRSKELQPIFKHLDTLIGRAK
jgi:hypothetical protein